MLQSWQQRRACTRRHAHSVVTSTGIPLRKASSGRFRFLSSAPRRVQRTIVRVRGGDGGRGRASSGRAHQDCCRQPRSDGSRRAARRRNSSAAGAAARQASGSLQAAAWRKGGGVSRSAQQTCRRGESGAAKRWSGAEAPASSCNTRRAHLRLPPRRLTRRAETLCRRSCSRILQQIGLDDTQLLSAGALHRGQVAF